MMASDCPEKFDLRPKDDTAVEATVLGTLPRRFTFVDDSLQFEMTGLDDAPVSFDGERSPLAVLLEAAEAYLSTSPCSDPDCCDRAKGHAAARENLAGVVARIRGHL
jgi:hypothetical protein